MKCRAIAWEWFAIFFENPFVNLVKRRMFILIVRFWRSIKIVEMCFLFGFPITTCFSAPKKWKSRKGTYVFAALNGIGVLPFNERDYLFWSFDLKWSFCAPVQIGSMRAAISFDPSIVREKCKFSLNVWATSSRASSGLARPEKIFSASIHFIDQEILRVLFNINP